MGTVNFDYKSNSNINNNKHDVTSSLNNKGVAPNLTSIHSLGAEDTLPKNNAKNIINISGNADDLHKANHEKQIDNITKLLSFSGNHITRKMVAKVLDAGDHGDKKGQELNVRPETALVVLTLFEHKEIPQELLNAAVDLVLDINNKDLNNDKNVKSILTGKQEILDKLLDKFLSNSLGGELKNLAMRYQETYVNGAIREQLSSHVSKENIERDPICIFLLSDVNMKQNVELFMASYNDLGKKNPGNRYQLLNEIFRRIEQKIEIIRPLNMNSQPNGQEKQDTPGISVEGLNSDQVDAGSTFGVPSTSISGSPNAISLNTISSYDFNSSFSKNLSNVSNSEVEPALAVENEESNGVDANHVSLSTFTKLFVPLPISIQKLTEPEVDYDELSQHAQDDEVDALIVPEAVTKKDTTVYGTLYRPENIVKKSQISALSQEPVLKKKEVENPFLPKHNFVAGNYQKNSDGKWVISNLSSQKTVTLSANGASTRNQSDKEIYQGEREAAKKVIDMSSHLPNLDRPVTLTERGALTRDQSDKEIYQGEREATKKVIDMSSHLPNLDRPVTLTERGALTRDQSQKEAYTTQE